MAHCVSLGILGQSQPLPSIARPDLAGVGLSDSSRLATALTNAFSYTNTFYHEVPLLDICAPSIEWLGFANFLTSSDVFEHVPSPVSAAFSGAYRVLKKNGLFVLTVPFDDRSATSEHFPGITRFKTIEFDNEFILVGKKSSGDIEVYKNPVFHGGPGTTVEMRFFGLEDLLSNLRDTGFVDIQVHAEPVPKFGIFPPHAQGLPITAWKR